MKSRMAALECGLFVCLFKSYSNRPVDPAGESIEVLSSLVKVGTIRTPGPVELRSVTREPVCRSVSHAGSSRGRHFEVQNRSYDRSSSPRRKRRSLILVGKFR